MLRNLDARRNPTPSKSSWIDKITSIFRQELWPLKPKCRMKWKPTKKLLMVRVLVPLQGNKQVFMFCCLLLGQYVCIFRNISIRNLDSPFLTNVNAMKKTMSVAQVTTFLQHKKTIYFLYICIYKICCCHAILYLTFLRICRICFHTSFNTTQISYCVISFCFSFLFQWFIANHVFITLY